MTRKKRSDQSFLIDILHTEESLIRIRDRAGELQVKHPRLSEKAAQVASVISLLCEGEMRLSHAKVGVLTSYIMDLVDRDFTTIPDNPMIFTLKWARATIQAYDYVRSPEYTPSNNRVNLKRALTHSQDDQTIPDDLR
jgi:hypothetical protein